jgi:ABC-type enterobactin transport system permease subunit
MREVIIEAAVCLFIGILSLAVAVWVVASGRIVYLDGIALVIIALTISAFFLFDVFWSYRTGELQQAVQDWRKAEGSESGK